MIIDFRKIARSGKTEEDFFFEYSPEEELVLIPDAKILSPVKITGKVTLTGKHSAYIDAEVCFSIEAECSRCLSVTVQDFVAEIAEEVDAEDEESYPVKNDTVDLTKIINDKILMTIPVSLLCREDCRGLCPTCGANLNEENCQCEK
jgi:uncharacterized protein